MPHVRFSFQTDSYEKYVEVALDGSKPSFYWDWMTDYVIASSDCCDAAPQSFLGFVACSECRRTLVSHRRSGASEVEYCLPDHLDPLEVALVASILNQRLTKLANLPLRRQKDIPSVLEEVSGPLY